MGAGVPPGVVYEGEGSGAFILGPEILTRIAFLDFIPVVHFAC